MGALTTDALVEAREAANASVVALPDGWRHSGPALALSPYQQTFEEPVIVQLPIDAERQAAVVMRLDDEQDTTWERLETLPVDDENSSFLAASDRLGIFTLATELQTPHPGDIPEPTQYTVDLADHCATYDGDGYFLLASRQWALDGLAPPISISGTAGGFYEELHVTFGPNYGDSVSSPDATIHVHIVFNRSAFLSHSYDEDGMPTPVHYRILDARDFAEIECSDPNTPAEPNCWISSASYTLGPNEAFFWFWSRGYEGITGTYISAEDVDDRMVIYDYRICFAPFFVTGTNPTPGLGDQTNRFSGELARGSFEY